MVQTPEDTPQAVIASLWIAVYGEPPPVLAAAPVMIGALVSGLPEPVWREDADRVSTARTLKA